MKKSLIALAGLILFAAGIITNINFNKGEKLAVSRNDEKKSYGMIAEGPLPCEWDVKTPERVMSENKSQAILINIKNQYDEKCESILTLRAPGFDATPIKEEQKISLESSKSGSLSWIIAPRKSGTYEFTVSDILNTKVFGITVTNTFGLNVVQAKALSILGSLFGPMFTIPWWWDRLRKKKELT